MLVRRFVFSVQFPSRTKISKCIIAQRSSCFRLNRIKRMRECRQSLNSNQVMDYSDFFKEGIRKEMKLEYILSFLVTVSDFHKPEGKYRHKWLFR
jgi:hypothetical protein